MELQDARTRAHVGVRRLGVPLLLVALLAAAGCGGSSSPKKAAITTLTIASPGAPPSLDPATGDNQYSDYFNLAYDPLIVQAADGTFKPGLATKWSYGPQNKTFTITLRSGVKFSDGTPLDGDAVKQWIEHTLKVPGGRAASYLGTLQRIDVPSPQQVVLRFKAPTPQLELVFSQVLEMGLIGSPKALSGKTLQNATAGAGPYKLDPGSTVKADHYTYVPNPNYHDKSAVHWKRVVIKVIANPSAALQALRAGQVQVAVGQTVSTLDAARKAGLESVSPLTLLLGLGLNDREGKLAKPLGDVRVRQALNYAVDRKAVARVVGAGHGEPIQQMAVPGDDSYDQQLAGAYPYDPAKAKQLLASAGYPKGFTLKTLASNVVRQDTLAQALAGQLAKVGVTLKPLDVKSQISDYFTNLANASDPVATIAFGRLPAVFDYGALYGPNAGPFNPFKTQSAQLDKLFAQLSVASGDAADTIARQMQGLITRQAWFLPVVATPLVVLHSSSVTGVNATPERDVIYTNEIRPK
jgi:peptide/nickel transport system substrate-binding protein